MKPHEILDCTFRDGGYYNNWHFDKKIINEYLKVMEKINIRHVEIGFRSLDKSKYRGSTAYSDDNFIKSLNVPKSIKLGVMINASELLNKKDSPLKITKKLFPKKNIDFIRIACHIDELSKIRDSIAWLKKENFFLAINLMQISEVKLHDIKKLCKYCNNLKIDILYLADSLGSLKTKYLLNIINRFKKNFNSEIGIHAHDNLNLAFKNSVAANKNGVKWIDCTINGMGRGAGNLKTENIIKKISNKKNSQIINEFINKRFKTLKKKYKWGPNKYYKLAAKYKIHPTYIQEMLSDKRYKNKDYAYIIKNLRLTEAKKFNPFNLIASLKFFKKDISNKKIQNYNIQGKDVLILGPGNSVKKNKLKIESVIKNKNLEVISLNNNYYINQKLIKLRVFCHPLRILSLLQNGYHFKSPILIPYNSISTKYKKKIINTKNKIIDYGLKINNKIIFKKKYCQIPSPLSIIYCLGFLVHNKVSSIYLTGFDGYKKDDAFSDETKYLLNKFLKKYKIIQLRRLKIN